MLYGRGTGGINKHHDSLYPCFRLESAIIEVAAESEDDPKADSKVRRKARGFLQEMVANISPAFIR